MTNFSDLRDFSWILVLLVGLVVLAIAACWTIAQRKKLAAERHAAWKTHRDWLQSSASANATGKKTASSSDSKPGPS